MFGWVMEAKIRTSLSAFYLSFSRICPILTWVRGPLPFSWRMICRHRSFWPCTRNWRSPLLVCAQRWTRWVYYYLTFKLISVQNNGLLLIWVIISLQTAFAFKERPFPSLVLSIWVMQKTEINVEEFNQNKKTSHRKGKASFSWSKKWFRAQWRWLWTSLMPKLPASSNMYPDLPCPQRKDLFPYFIF